MRDKARERAQRKQMIIFRGVDKVLYKLMNAFIGILYQPVCSSLEISTLCTHIALKMALSLNASLSRYANIRRQEDAMFRRVTASLNIP
jgi:hypothetical protein